jgi:hypothetical protein
LQAHCFWQGEPAISNWNHCNGYNVDAPGEPVQSLGGAPKERGRPSGLFYPNVDL